MDYETITELNRVHKTRKVGEAHRVPCGKGCSYYTIMRLHIFKVPQFYLLPSLMLEIDGLKGERIVWLSLGLFNFTISLRFNKN